MLSLEVLQIPKWIFFTDGLNVVFVVSCFLVGLIEVEMICSNHFMEIGIFWLYGNKMFFPSFYTKYTFFNDVTYFMLHS